MERDENPRQPTILGGIFKCRYNKDLTLLDGNREIFEFLGYTEKEFSRFFHNKGVSVVYAEDRQPLFASLEKQFETGEPIINEFRVVCQDQSIRWVWCSAEQFCEDGGYLLCMFHDITAQKELENQLELYRSASRGGAFVCRVDEGFTLLYANDIYYQVHEINAADVPEKWHNHCIESVYPEDRSHVWNAVSQALEKGERKVSFEMRAVTGENNIRWLKVYGSFEKREGVSVINGFVIDNTVAHELMEKLAYNEQRYRIALEQTNTNLWEYDIPGQRLILYGNEESYPGGKRVIEGVPDILVEAGYIHPDSVDAYLAMHSALKKGEKSVKAEFRNQSEDGIGWIWTRVTYTVICDEGGHPKTAVAVGEDITRQKEADIRYHQELQMRSVLSENVLASSRSNLTKNRVELLQWPQGDAFDGDIDLSYDEMYAIGGRNIINAEDRERYRIEFSREALLAAFKDNKRHISLDCRFETGRAGKLIWVNLSMRLVKDTESRDVYAYGIIRNIDEQKTIELALEQRVDKDGVTGAYNSESGARMMREAACKNLKANRPLILVIFSVDHFNKRVETYGYQVMETVLKELSAQIFLKFKDPKIVSRPFTDEIAVLAVNYSSADAVWKNTKDIRLAIGRGYLFSKSHHEVTVSVGIACSGRQINSYEKLQEKAGIALALAKADGGNQCRIYTADMDSALILHPEETAAETVFPDKPDGGQISQILLTCAFSLSRPGDFEKALTRVLRDINTYYGADSTYLCEFEKNSLAPHRVYEWRERGGAITREKIIALGKNGQKAIERMLQYDVMFFKDIEIDSVKREFPEVYGLFKKEGIHAYAYAVLVNDSRKIGYMVINNPTARTEEQKLFSSIRYFIANELVKRQLLKKQAYLGYYDELTGLLNRNSFANYQSQLVEESLISLGVVSMNLNRMKKINKEFGNQHGDSIVRATADAVRESFPGKLMFRMAGDEFLILCENQSRESFIQNVKKCQRAIDAFYSYKVAIGYAWADQDFRLTSLIARADEQMSSMKRRQYQQYGYGVTRYSPVVLENLIRSIRKNEFKMYLQPKASIPDGKITGAEALVRYAHPDYGLVTPDKFIPLLEKSGFISYIDLFILESVCRWLVKRKDCGEENITVSLNFSRHTMAEENLIDTVAEILQKYDFNRQLVEIEITESLGDIERDTIAHIGRQLARQGFRLSLDDFGAKYSNMSILSTMKFDVVKLDKSLVNDLLSNKNTRIIVKNFLTTCRDMGIESVAEGVETKEQFDLLAEMGCDYAQGYYFNKPIPEREFERLYMQR